MYFLGSVTVIASLIAGYHGNAQIVGGIGSILSVALMAAPLSVVTTVISERSTDSLPFTSRLFYPPLHTVSPPPFHPLQSPSVACLTLLDTLWHHLSPRPFDLYSQWIRIALIFSSNAFIYSLWSSQLQEIDWISSPLINFPQPLILCPMSLSLLIVARRDVRTGISIWCQLFYVHVSEAQMSRIKNSFRYCPNTWTCHTTLPRSLSFIHPSDVLLVHISSVMISHGRKGSLSS
jgi:hypothetical protein